MTPQVMHDYSNEEPESACKSAFDASLASKPEKITERGDVWSSPSIQRHG